MLKRYVIYDPTTGEITGRITCDELQAVHYPTRKEITAVEFTERPELFQRVDVAEQALVALSEQEALAKGADQKFIDEKIAAGLMTKTEVEEI
jgi:hypothetical protein